MSDDLNTLLLGFTDRLKVKNYSSKSIVAYGEHLRGFFDYLKETGVTDVKRVTREVLKTYQLNLSESGGKRCRNFAGATIGIKLRAVKRFFEHLEEINHILINPAEYLKEPKKETRLPRAVLTGEEVRRILDTPDLSSITGIRDRTVLEVFYSTGIRLAELISLTIYDCDLQGGLLRVRGKFSKDRLVPLGRHAVKFLRGYITRVRLQHADKNKAVKNLFITNAGDPLSSQIIQLMVRRYAKDAGIGKKVTPHVFRHTFATGLVRNGADIRAVQKMLGHSDLRTTQIYTKVAGTEVKSTHSKHHPRERDSEERETEPKPEGMKKYRRKYFSE